MYKQICSIYHILTDKFLLLCLAVEIIVVFDLQPAHSDPWRVSLCHSRGWAMGDSGLSTHSSTLSVGCSYCLFAMSLSLRDSFFLALGPVTISQASGDTTWVHHSQLKSTSCYRLYENKLSRTCATICLYLVLESGIWTTELYCLARW